MFICAGLAFALTSCAKDEPSQIPALMEAAHVPGLTVATIDDCKVSDVSYFGFADVDSGEAVGPDTVFEAASLTKTIFAIIVNQLANEGVIDLDTPLAETFAAPRVPDQEGYEVLTPRIILEHRSGFPNWAGNPLDPETWGPIEFKNPPNTKFGYSGEAFMLLQAYVENATGKSLKDLFDERLGALMPHTSLSGLKNGVAPAFAHDNNGTKEEGRALIAAPTAGAAYSAITNANDYAQLLGFLCEGGGMSEAARAEMLRPQSPTDDARISWALGWGVQIAPDATVIFHWGDNGPFKTFTAFNPQTRDGVVYFANGFDGLKLIEPIAEPVVGDVTPIADWLDYGRID